MAFRYVYVMNLKMDEKALDKINVRKLNPKEEEEAIQDWKNSQTEHFLSIKPQPILSRIMRNPCPIIW